MLSYKTPGVYIEELPSSGPIEGVGTSTVAFIGPASQGPINVPTKITNWTEYKALFGDYMVSPQRRYLSYAVRGFYLNGGTVAYVVRVSKAHTASLDLLDRGAIPSPTVTVTALREGLLGNTISAQVADAQIINASANARVRRAQASTMSATGNVITLQNASDGALFKSGDMVTLVGTTERVAVDRVRGDKVLLVANLSTTYGASAVLVADLAIAQTTFRVENGGGIEPGSVLHLAQGAVSEDVIVDKVVGEFVTLAGAGLTHAYSLTQAATNAAITSYEFSLTFSRGPTVESFTNLSLDSRHSRYFVRVVDSTLVTASPSTVPSVQSPPKNRPAVVAATPLAGGMADDVTQIGLNEYQDALDALVKVDDINIVCAPDASQAAQAAVVAHCEQTADRFAILDPTGPRLEPFGAGSIEAQRAAVESARGYAALYYPWIQINDPTSLTGQDTIFIPPSGHLAGIYARSDAQRGVHKAPANESMQGVVGLSRIVDGTEQGELNIEGINVLRIFPGKGLPVVWGARTTAPRDDTSWRYVNVRRLFLFIEESIQQGINWAVFEPNDLTLWKKLARTLDEFLTRVWRSGALFGKSAKEAFYIKIDEENNPPSVRALGQVIIEVGVAPVRPAEFVIVRIGLWDGGSSASES